MRAMTSGIEVSADRPGPLIATIADDADAIGDGEDFLQAVRDVDDRQPLVPQSAQEGEEALRLSRTEGGVRLIHDDDLGLLLQRARNLDQLLLGDRELANFGPRVERDGHLRQDLFRSGHHLTLVEQPRSERRLTIGEDVAGDREMGEEIELLKDDADPEPAGMEGIGDDDRFAAQHQRAAVRLVDAGQHLHDGRLAGAVLPHHGVDLAAADAEGDVVDGGDASESLDHVIEPDDLVLGGWGRGHG